MTLDQLIAKRISLLSQVETMNNEIRDYVDGFITYVVTYSNNVKIERVNNYQVALDMINFYDENNSARIITNKPVPNKFDLHNYNHIVGSAALTGSDSKDHIEMLLMNFINDCEDQMFRNEERSDYDGEY